MALNEVSCTSISDVRSDKEALTEARWSESQNYSIIFIFIAIFLLFSASILIA